MSNLQRFVNDSLNCSVRVVDREGNPWFVAKDVCDCLGVGNSRQALTRLDEDERNTVIISDGTPGNPTLAIVSEAGMYSLVLRSRKPEAKAFKRWITHDVLPSIRKTGMYKAPEDLKARIEEVAVVTAPKGLVFASAFEFLVDRHPGRRPTFDECYALGGAASRLCKARGVAKRTIPVPKAKRKQFKKEYKAVGHYPLSILEEAVKSMVVSD